ncbi:MAG: formylglycine-generating enzyme family protein [Magnetococcales bacterium]|nr:formylglycine-generating enzyme family protein [Magnetococcales bacterium]
MKTERDMGKAVGRVAKGALLAVGLACLFQPTLARAFLINSWEPVAIGEVKESNSGDSPQPGYSWTEPVTKMEMIWLSGGCYQMGSPPKASGRDADEGPVHQACLSGFWMGRYEVTQGQWEKIVRNNPASFRKGHSYPIEGVSWEDIEGFLDKLNGQQSDPKIRFRLPTEAEWEFACRNGGKRVRYAGGETPDQLGWYRQNSGRTTQVVGSREANSLGFGDMSGNVWEWVGDTYSRDSYKRHTRDNPSWEGHSGYRVIRGGGWESQPGALRCANRGFELFSTRRPDLGLRLVAVLDQTVKKRPKLSELPF